MSVRTSVCFASLTALVLSSSASAQSTLFNQSPPVSGTAVSISITTGGNTVGFANRRVADNFAMTAPVELSSIRFWGGDETSTPDPDLLNLEGFNIRIFDRATNGNPGNVVFDSGLISLTALSPTREGTLLVGLNQAPMYRFDYTLPAPLTLAAGTPYFLSVAGDVINVVDFTNEAWQWAAGPTGDTNIWQDRFNGSGFLPQTLSRRNAAFVLSGTIVPEPGLLSLTLAGGLLLTRRTRKHP